MRNSMGQFSKGNKPQNPIKNGERRGINTEFKKGCVPWGKGKKIAQLQKENHWNWKGGISQNRKYRNWQKNQRNRTKRVNGGSHTFAEWETLKAQYNWTCLACRKTESEIKLTEDHIIPVSKGGSDNIENIQPLCLKCNLSKHTRTTNYLIVK